MISLVKFHYHNHLDSVIDDATSANAGVVSSDLDHYVTLRIAVYLLQDVIQNLLDSNVP